MEHQDQQKRQQIMQKLKETDQKVQEIIHSKDEEIMLKREMEALKRKDREETVMRIAKINEYQKQKIMEKIQADDERSRQL